MRIAQQAEVTPLNGTPTAEPEALGSLTAQSGVLLQTTEISNFESLPTGPAVPAEAETLLKPQDGGMPTASASTAAEDGSWGWNLPAAEVRRQAVGILLLSLFHGPLGRRR